MNRLKIAAAAMLLQVALVGVAAAHAFLDGAEPSVGSVISRAPDEIRLQFTQPVEAVLSSVSLRGPRGDVALGDAATPERDHRLLVAAVRGEMVPGLYHVYWRVVSVDTHKTQGDFTFEYRP